MNPRKYASNAERQRAYRRRVVERNALRPRCKAATVAKQQCKRAATHGSLCGTHHRMHLHWEWMARNWSDRPDQANRLLTNCNCGGDHTRYVSG